MDNKYLELEFDIGTTYDEIEEAFNYYKRKGILAMTKINGYTIFNNTSDLKEDFFKTINQIPKEQLQKLTKLKKEKEIKEKLLSRFLIVKCDKLYMYYINLAELFVISEKKRTIFMVYD